jgi:MFS transporter, NNP family, nitrate/nitrite transporter
MMGMLVFTVFCSMSARVIFSPIMPTLQSDFGFTLTVAGSLFLLVNVSYGLALLLAGFLSSRIGHGRTIGIALAAISTGLVLAAMGSELWMLTAGIVVIGAGAGLYPSSGLVMINTAIEEKRRSTAFSVHEVGPNLALLVAPLFVLAIEPALGWRGVLATLAALTALASLAFFRWGAAGSGHGAAPNLSTVATVLRLRTTVLAIVVLSAGLSGVQGVYAILPAYLVSQHGLSSNHVNLLVSLSRVAGIVLLLQAGPIINRVGVRKTIAVVLIASAVLTSLIGLAQGTLLLIVVVAQPTLLSVLFPAALAAIGGIGDVRYQNITYSLVITIAVSIGSGLAPTMLGVFGDLRMGWLGFTILGVYMAVAVIFLWTTPRFGRIPPASEESAPKET